MITIHSYPNEIEFTGNPIAFPFTSDNYITSQGSKSYVKLRIAGNFINTHQITISFLDYVLVFSVGGDPDSGLYLQAGSLSCTTVVGWFNKNYILTQFFEIYVHDNDEFFIRALNVGSAFSLSVDVSEISALQIIPQVYPGTDLTFNPNFKIFVQLYFKSKFMLSYSKMPGQYFDVDSSSQCVVYLNKQLKTICEDKKLTFLPAFNSHFFSESKETVFHYFVKFAECFGSPGVVKGLNSTDVLHVLNGKLPFDQYPGHDTIEKLQQTKQFLTNQGFPVETYKSAQQVLYWMNCEDRRINQVGLIVRAYRKAVPGYMQLARDWAYNINQFDVLVCPSGHDQLYMGLYGDCYQYEVFVAEMFENSPPVPLSQIVTFTLVPQKQFSKQLLFKNDFGVYEFLCAEKVLNKFDIETEVFQKELSYDYQLPKGQLVVKPESSYNKFTIRTGTMKKVLADHLCEMLSNNEVYIVGKLQFIPIIIEKGTLELSDEADDIFTVKFDYRYTINGTLSPTA
jgi:hypothetical protein